MPVSSRFAVLYRLRETRVLHHLLLPLRKKAESPGGKRWEADTVPSVRGTRRHSRLIEPGRSADFPEGSSGCGGWWRGAGDG